MRVNLPVTHQSFDFPADELLVSTTNAKGEIVHCNPAFVRVSGYSYDELIGQPHNIIRHPDMPMGAFRDMWRTVARGDPWTGLIKNRRADGAYYWVQANVTPILHQGAPRGYMSVRSKPSPAQVQEAEALYAVMRENEQHNRNGVGLNNGSVRHSGIRGWMARWKEVNLFMRMVLGLLAMVLIGSLPELLQIQGLAATLLRIGGMAVVGLLILWRYHSNILRALDEASRFSGDLSACNLNSSVDVNFPAQSGMLMRRLQQIQINLQAVVGDVRTETRGFNISAGEITRGSYDLSERTEAQASSLEQTAASMEELASTVSQTADHAQKVSRQSEESSAAAQRGGKAVRDVEAAMREIQQSSSKISEISSVIESIAFQTNILALNAAVEAARAGEQGRGFAVVAAEVRALSQRSAGAAKEISQLIGGTVMQIGIAAKQVEHAGSTIAQMVDSVQGVGELVGQISYATHEQSLGISQVNAAVNQLDMVTQQNAALVQQSAAQAQSLKVSAGSLSRSLDVFSLG